MSAIPLVDLRRQHAPLIDDLRDAFERVVKAGALILGEEVTRFEAEFATYCGVRHCVGVSSGTAALALAMRAAGFHAGEEVIVPAHTFIASALSVVDAGLTPVFCDVRAADGLIDVDSAETVVTHKTVAVLPVHLYGQAADMDAVARFAERHALAVIEDAAQAHGVTWRGRRAGSIGLAGGFSFYPSKNLGALGDGGAICTDDDDLAERARMLRNLGQRRKGEHVVHGYNERLDGLQAAVLRVKLPHLDGWNRQRREAAALYRELLDDRLRLIEEPSDAMSTYHVFAVRSPDRDALAERLETAGVATGVHYHPAVHQQPPFLATRPRELPKATAWAREELSLPMFPGLDRREIRHVAEACVAAAGD